MDRRDNPEVPNSHSDEQFQKAYEVISLSYRGGEPERLYREAITCFDCLIDISHGNEATAEFAHRRGIDMKYLVDGASFVISKMHFNPENNYYITLGLPRNATPEELSRRWKKFMLLYHPDKQVGNEEWVSERAKKVNEAYTALKDETKRAEYDHKLTAETLSRRFPSHPSPDSTYHPRPAKTFGRQSSRSSSNWSSIRPYMTKILMGLYIFIALVVFGIIYIQNRSSNLEAELVAMPAKPAASETMQTQVPIAPNKAPSDQYITNTPATIPAVPAEPKKEPAPASQTAGQSAEASSALQTMKGWFKPRETKQPPAKGRVEDYKRNSILPEKTPTKVQDKAAVPLIEPQRPSIPEQARKDDPAQQRSEVQKLPAEQQTVRQEPVRPVQEARQQAAAPPKTEQIGREEVQEFMQRYVRAYTQSDLETFLSLYSRSAVENNSLTYNEIRNAYKETFREKINHYRISDMDIRTDGQTATVSGIYNVNRYLAEQDRWVRYSGKIAWKLVRENSQLRIISTIYDK